MEKGNNGLPTREAASFKKLVKCWEEKQWKVGLRLAKQILGARGCADHGETLAMKGLLPHAMGACPLQHGGGLGPAMRGFPLQ